MRSSHNLSHMQGSFSPRDRRYLDTAMDFSKLSLEQVHLLEERLVTRWRSECKRYGGAIPVVDEAGAPTTLQLTDSEQIRHISAAFEQLREEDFDVELVQLPLPSDGAPSSAELDKFVEIVRQVEWAAGGCLVVSCEDGGDKTNTGILFAALYDRAVNTNEEEEPEPEEEEEPEGESEGDEPEGEAENGQNVSEGDHDEGDDAADNELEGSAADADDGDDPRDEDVEPEEKDTSASAKAVNKEKKAEQPRVYDASQGEYAAIMSMVSALGKRGERYKAHVDSLLEQIPGSNLRNDICALKSSFDLSTDDDERSAIRTKATALVQRYFYCIAFYAYLKAALSTDFEQSFTQWNQGSGWFSTSNELLASFEFA